ncbi:LacI family transcriptional regulator [Chitinophaga agrisoli]|uniref:LacI family transcriptional regulator n=1 Tax=Chitinophaga agrisoli TaxID=2607653 RepID=A0A5B2W1S2_9BACT|nr:LacI family DNA-binding transcriptional regulator [Chitinophaga agrisoli]KAA2244720.1 LacI family transcriptional regulator [Chitinophaga agrisoli]
MKNKQVTIKDLARKLRLSVSTVSRALRNLPDINEETRRKVLELAAGLNYEPNYIAQSLINKQTRTIGVIVPIIATHFFSHALSGMNEVANEHGYHLMFCQSNESAEQEAEGIRQLASCRIDGLLISVSKQTQDAAPFEKLQQKGIPFMFFDRDLRHVTASRVIVDQYKGAFKAVEHMIQQGCQNIVHMAGPKGLSVADERLRGYKDAVEKHGLPFSPKHIVHCGKFQLDAPEAIKKLMKLQPDGIFCINDPSGVIAIQHLKTTGYCVPGDVKVVGFNGDPVAEVVEPALSTVVQPGYKVGREALKMLIRHIEEKSLETEELVLEGKLVIRKSSKMC